jgi:hypothetical protein
MNNTFRHKQLSPIDPTITSAAAELLVLMTNSAAVGLIGNQNETESSFPGL